MSIRFEDGKYKMDDTVLEEIAPYVMRDPYCDGQLSPFTACIFTLDGEN